MIVAEISAATVTALTVAVGSIITALATAVIQVIQAMKGPTRDQVLRDLTDRVSAIEANTQAVVTRQQDHANRLTTLDSGVRQIALATPTASDAAARQSPVQVADTVINEQSPSPQPRAEAPVPNPKPGRIQLS